MKHLLAQSWIRLIHLIQKNPSHSLLYGFMITLSSMLVFVTGNILQLTGVAQKNPNFALIFQVLLHFQSILDIELLVITGSFIIVIIYFNKLKVQ